ncbi:retrotransposable element Tf2, partial [Tanacetum coccineum]
RESLNLTRREAIGFDLYLKFFDTPKHASAATKSNTVAECDQFTVADSGLAFCDKFVGYGSQAQKGQLIKSQSILGLFGYQNIVITRSMAAKRTGGDYGSRIESNAQSITKVGDMVLGLSTQLTNFMKRGKIKLDDIDGESDEDDKLEDSGCSLVDLIGWLLKVEQKQVTPSWKQYVKDITSWFGAPYDDPMAELMELKQTGSVTDVHDKFDCILSRLQFPPKYALSCFLSVLNEDISNMVNNNRRTLTAAEMDEKRSKGLCFFCDDKYTFGHNCRGKRPQLFHLEVEEEEYDGEGELEENDVVVEIPNEVTEFAKISVNAISSVTDYKTIRIVGHVGTTKVQMLMDTKSSHNFIDYALAVKLGCKMVKRNPMAVRVVDGNKIQCDTMVQDFKWKMHSIEFSIDLMVMHLGGSDMVLGIQWFVTLGKVTFDFDNRCIEFDHKGRKVVLRGSDDKPIQTVGEQKMRQTIQQGGEICMLQVLAVEGEEYSNDLQVKVVADAPVSKDIQQLIQKKEQNFQDPVNLPPFRPGYDHKITLKEGSNPVNLRPYRYPVLQKDVIEKMTKEFLEQGIIKHSNSAFASPVVLVKKKDGGWRMCIDYRSLNKSTIPDRFPIPLVEEFKCAFGVAHIEYLGHVISDSGVATDPMKIKEIVEWPSQVTLNQLRGFLGLTGYYRRFIKDYGGIAKPLTQLLKKDSFEWNSEADKAFQHLKQAMITPPVLALPDFSSTFIIETDASSQGIGVVLMHHGYPIAFISKALSPKNLMLSTYERELLAVIHEVLKWNHYLLDKHFIIKTDQESLKYLLEHKLATPFQQKMGLQATRLNPSSHSRYQWTGKELRRNNKLVIGNDTTLKQKLLHWMHNSPQGGHSGISATLKRIQSLFYWPKLRTDVQTYIKECEVCQKCKADLAASPGLLQPLPIPKAIWEDIAMDFIEGLPISKGKSVILVVIGRLKTRFS